MKKINEYLDHLFKGNTSKEALELKEEMKQHLLDEVRELKNQGLDEELAIKTALNHFGDNHSLKKELDELLVSNKKLVRKAKIYAVLGILMAIIAIVFGFMYYQNYNSHLDVMVQLVEGNYPTVQVKGNEKYYELIELDSDEDDGYIKVIKLKNFSGDVRIYNNTNVFNEADDIEMNAKNLDVKILDSNDDIIADTSHLSPTHHYLVELDNQECLIFIKKFEKSLIE
ncbi:MAG: permease prefix domain 1-containing protein [Turicibacter sp.]